jgi:hypothetical protein
MAARKIKEKICEQCFYFFNGTGVGQGIRCLNENNWNYPEWSEHSHEGGRMPLIPSRVFTCKHFKWDKK